MNELNIDFKYIFGDIKSLEQLRYISQIFCTLGLIGLALFIKKGGLI